jgi:hypothetical protein
MAETWHGVDCVALALLACLQLFQNLKVVSAAHFSRCIRGQKFLQRLKAINDRSRLTACQRVQLLNDNQSVVTNLRPLFPNRHSSKHFLSVEIQHASAAGEEELRDSQLLYPKTCQSGGLCPQIFFAKMEVIPMKKTCQVEASLSRVQSELCRGLTSTFLSDYGHHVDSQVIYVMLWHRAC